MRVPTRDFIEGTERAMVGINHQGEVNKPNSVEHWQERFASTTPSISSLHAAPSHSSINSSIHRRFHVKYENLTQNHGIEPSTLIALAYALVLSAHTSSPDGVIFGYVYGEQSAGTPDREGTDPFSRPTLAHNVTFDWDKTTLDFLRDLQSDIAQIGEHTLAGLPEAPTPNSSALSRTVLNCYPLSTSNYKLRTENSVTDDAEYNLAFLAQAIGCEEIAVEARFTHLSEPEIEVFQDHFGTALNSIVKNLTGPLRDVELVSPEERQRLVVERNPTYSAGPSSSAGNNVTELIEDQARRTPQRIALQFGQEMFITYHEMDAFANDLARTLIGSGVKRGDVVGIYMSNSCEMFITILAIHKSGGGYVPLDPSYPVERIQMILGLADAKIVITGKDLKSHLDSIIPAGHVSSLVVDVLELSPSRKPRVAVGRDDICHILFTSGTTGKPKGVVVTHGAIIESLIGAHEVFGRRDDRVLQFSGYTFDYSVWDWSVTLTDGGTLCIAPKRDLLDHLGIVAHSMDVTFLETTPTVMTLIKPVDVPTLQTLAVGGEPLTSEVRNAWADVVSLANVYGSTEASANVIAKMGLTSSTDCSNIGRCFGRNAAYVLDDRLRPTPLGCVGQLFISGPELARKYLNNPEQTARAFMDDPFRPGSMMYATGDLVRTSPTDDSLFYVGRRDMQIKIRGLQVEIGEIETVLKAASNLIRNAVVIKVNADHDALIAFLEYPSDSSDSDAKPTIIHNGTVGSLLLALKGAVHKKLPSYMAPRRYVVLDKFPLSASGKLDRKALTNFFHLHKREINRRADSTLSSALSSSGSKAKLGNEREAVLRSLWASTLHLDEASLSIADDFYTVGGDSISAIRLASAARAANIPLLATDIIANPTIYAMARIAESSIVNHNFDDDDVPPAMLDKMSPADLSLMDVDQNTFDALRDDTLPKHGLLPRYEGLTGVFAALTSVYISDVVDIYPCTALQTSFLVAGLVGDSAYVVKQAYDLPAGTTSVRLRRAFENFMRHFNGAFLRTTFVFDPSTNRFLQVVMRPAWRRMEWTTVIVADETELDKAIVCYQDGRGAMKFEDGEVRARVCVFELAGFARALCWCWDQTLADHWTISNAEADICNIYACRSVPLRRSVKPMVKFLEGLDRTAGVDFWRRHLLDAIPTPFLQAHPEAPRAAVNATVHREVCAKHSSLTKRFGIMPSSLVTAAWAIVLSAHTGSLDVVFGQIMSGRNAPIKDVDSMAGNTANKVARRVILNPETSVLETLRRVQLEQIEVSKYEHISLADLVSQGLPVNGLFRSLLNFKNLSGDQKESGGERKWSTEDVLGTYRPGSLDGQDLPFALSVTPSSSGSFFVEVSYSREVITQREVDTILDHFETALTFLMNHPDATIDDVELTSAVEKRRLLFGVNPPHPLHGLLSPALNVSELIEWQVTKTPQRIALQFEQEVFLTYGQMDSLSNALARSLINGGIKRGTLVGIYMDKSIEMFLSILAVHKAGGGYVPLDPEHPPERIQTVVGLAQATMVLTTRELKRDLDSVLVNTDVRPVLVDWSEISPATKPEVGPIGRDDISHVLFTSGSTGTPKGVVLTHGSTIESALGSREALGTLDGRVLQFSNYTFDFSVWDWTGTLSAGGTLCVVPKRRLMDGLESVARSLDVTYMGVSPTVAALITPEGIPSLLTVCVGGELLTPMVRNAWADAVSFVNAYGPTEANVGILARRGVTSFTPCSNVGWRFGLNSIYILDERRRPVPLGCVGELFISGPQLGRGYLNKPEETAKAFINNPFRPGSLMYATGDLVRMSAEDESITFVDRRDTQIKIRGLRVEAGEIEAVLQATSNAVTNAAVIKVDIGHDSLVAFLEYPSAATTDTITMVHSDRLGPLLTSLRHAVREKLPVYMAPTFYVALNRFPVSTSGKLDRKTLKTLFYSHATTIQEMTLRTDNITVDEQEAAPLTGLQATIRSLLASTLRIPEASLRIDDDFYATGGDSISAIRLATAAREAGIHLPATDIIRNPTIRAMTQIAESAVINHDYDEDDIPSVALDQMCPGDLTLLDFDQAQLDALRDILLPRHGASVQDAYIVSQAWDLPSGTESIRLRQAFEDFVDHANGMMLRTMFVFEPTSNRWLQILIRPGAKRMEWATVIVADEAELDSRVDEYRQGRSIQQFEDGELLTRACLFEIGDRPRVLVWSLHHALTDHQTLDNIISDIANVYAGRTLPPRRPFKPMVSYLEKMDRTSGLDFWRRHLQDAAPTPFLQSLPGAPRATTDATVTRAVHTEHGSFARRSGIMPSTLVTAAWAIVLAAHSNCGDVVFGQILGGRNAPIKDIGSMTGITINTVARRVAPNAHATVIETLRHIQSDQIEMSKHEHITLADLHSEGIPVSGLFKTFLNFRNFPNNQGVEGASSANAGTLFRKEREGVRDGLDFPFALSVDVTSTDELFLSVEFLTKTISEAEVNGILDHFETALLFLMHHPDATIGDVELTSAMEKHRLLFGKNPPHPLDKVLSPARNVSELIESQVARTPQRIALQFEQEVFLTYGEMDSLSNGLACSLINGGIERGTLVGIYMDKSIEMFLSILAVHKAGGGYVPLDPEHPPERIQTIVGLAQAKMVLTTRELKRNLDSVLVNTDVRAVFVDFREISPATKPDVGPIGRDDISHVLFTSGSTGTPKGVVLTHGSTIESALGSREALGTLDGRVLQFSNYTFDFSVWDWTGTLSAGGTLCVVPKRRLLDDLESVARNLDVTYMGASPTVAALITPDGIPSLLTLGVGGELLTAAVRDAWADNVCLVNAYGPTEANVGILARRGLTTTTGCSNVGWRFGVSSVYILDERRRPVPLGCVGELFISGPQLARGYLNLPKETAKAFLNDPFRPGSLMYATGDLVRMSPEDESITFVDRRDTQIKIRGLRVEAGEIEAVLQATSNAVTNAVVAKVNVGHDALLAFVECQTDIQSAEIVMVWDDGTASLLSSLKLAVRQKLPVYMAPAMYVVLNRFPLTSSGKLHRKALVEFFEAHKEEIRTRDIDTFTGPIESTVLPHTESQALIRTLWASVLHVNEGSLSVDVNFYVAGGDSILAIRLATLARQAGLSLLPTDIIRHPTIRAMAEIASAPSVFYEFVDDTPSVTLERMTPTDLTLLNLDSEELDFLRNKLLPKHGLCPSDIIDVYPSTYLQTSFLLAGLMVDHAYINNHVYDLPRDTDGAKLRQAFESFLNHSNGAMLRTVFVFDPRSNRYLQALVKPGVKRMEWTTVAVADEAELSTTIDEYQRGRNSRAFADGNLLTRAYVFEINGSARALVWVLHHALHDGWTQRGHVSDIEDTYAGRPLPVRRSFKHMVKYLEGLDRAAGLEFWKHKLQSATPTAFLQPLPGAARAIRMHQSLASFVLATPRWHANSVSWRQRSRRPHGLLFWLRIQGAQMSCSVRLLLGEEVEHLALTSGAGAPISDIDTMIGTCINTVPPPHHFGSKSIGH
ncbi:acetyl-CoA synthetase-like protein [Ramaria rubella]|nr:acetyl-CoA synthetase-like protein [Ramaria rubella]